MLLPERVKNSQEIESKNENNDEYWDKILEEQDKLQAIIVRKSFDILNHLVEIQTQNDDGNQVLDIIHEDYVFKLLQISDDETDNNELQASKNV